MSADLGQPLKMSFEEKYQVDSVVEYLPHVCHAFNCNQHNEYPWVIGLKQNPHYVEDPSTGEKEIVEDVVELEEGHMHRNVLPSLFVSPDPREGRRKLVPIRPRKPWKAVVRAVNADGTLDLDIESNVGASMVTLGYDCVPVDESGKTPHTCRKGGR